jgi:hypothetical protein
VALDEPKGWVALFIGIVVVALGGIPLLSKLGVIGFNLGFLENAIGVVGAYIIVAVGLYLLIDSFMEYDELRVISVIVAIVVVAIGLITSLHSLGMLGFGIPSITPLVYSIIFVIEGIFLILAAFVMQ